MAICQRCGRIIKLIVNHKCSQNYLCDKCGLMLSTRTHRCKWKSYSCHSCGAEFRKKSNCLRHIKPHCKPIYVIKRNCKARSNTSGEDQTRPYSQFAEANSLSTYRDVDPSKQNNCVYLSNSKQETVNYVNNSVMDEAGPSNRVMDQMPPSILPFKKSKYIHKTESDINSETRKPLNYEPKKPHYRLFNKDNRPSQNGGDIVKKAFGDSIIDIYIPNGNHELSVINFLQLVREKIH